ncbi:hypothetical protein WN55_06682 [Dufourea novaeangliae]|uniref:Uncharacterized protein n=1 Tax=Dufourea novaeangliae TaxID=178035 RepID=A0A154PQT5_DUFNO|nr:hypothetical protein WN55_06682 [Dufourea novaeangliae]
MPATIKIDPLNCDSYDTWKIHMRAILKKNDLWEYVIGKIPKPAQTDPKYEKWIKLDGKAESDILLAVSASELIALDGLDTSKQIWDKFMPPQYHKKLREIGLAVIDELLAILLLYSLHNEELPTTEALKIKIMEKLRG